MSTVRIFDVPHVFRYGRTDEEKGESWCIFWRNATSFSVDIKRDDIVGTPFEQEWSKFIIEPKNYEDPGVAKQMFQRWNDLCDCLIKQILPTLQELAPTDGGHQWTTLEDYLTTPQYELRLFRDDTTGDAVAKIMSGPIPTPAFDFEPQPFSELQLPRDFPHISASEIIVLDHAKDLRQPPHKVCISKTGEVVSLVGAETSATYMDTGVTVNDSLVSMSSMLRLHDIDKPLNMSKPLAVVTTTSKSPKSSDVLSTSGHHQNEPNLRIAGLLHTPLPDTGRSLSETESIELAVASTTGIAQRWKAELTSLLKVLHSHGIVHGNVCPHTILIDYSKADGASPSDDVWLKAPWAIPNHFLIDPANAGTEAADWQGLENTFGGWLDFEMRKAKGDLKDGEGENWSRLDMGLHQRDSLLHNQRCLEDMRATLT